MDKPFSLACERNREPILDVLQQHFGDRNRVLEIGSGTGQHAVHFADALSHLEWQASDVDGNLAGIRAWLDEVALPNTPAPIAWNVRDEPPARGFDAVFTANTLHIMSWEEVERLFSVLPDITTDDARLVVYGPFNYDGQATSDSNAQFDRWLRSEDAQRGLRDFEKVDALARAAGFELVEDRSMPANNRCIVWERAG
jgi:cyclopropane fatty-acyl-phospholipid synthase-like methyltransferase